jgi:hypothetical protein
MVVGSRPRVTLSQVVSMLVAQFDVPDGSFTVHGYEPDDFMVIFQLLFW